MTDKEEYKERIKEDSLTLVSENVYPNWGTNHLNQTARVIMC